MKWEISIDELYFSVSGLELVLYHDQQSIKITTSDISTTLALNEGAELHLFRKGVRCDSFLIKEVINIYHHYITQEKIEIVTITEHERIIHSFNEEAELEVTTCHRL